MDHLIAFVNPGFEMFNIFRNIDGGCFWKDFFIVIFLINFFWCNVNAVLIIFSIQNDVEWKIVYMISFFQFLIRSQVLSALKMILFVTESVIICLLN